MVNPNKGFKWHQDNQNGPITWEEGLRFWITMDETPKDYGAPVYLKGSHFNTAVDDQAVFVDIQKEGLEEYRDKKLEFRTMPGDMLIWHPRTIHKVDGPSDGIWDSYRRVLGGTAAKAGSLYHDKRGTGGVLSDLGRHGLKDQDKLDSSFFPIVYPQFDKSEAAERDSGKVGRNPVDIVTKKHGHRSSVFDRGQLKVLDGKDVIWASGLDASLVEDLREHDFPFHLVVQDDGNVVIYTQTCKEVWALGTQNAERFDL